MCRLGGGDRRDHRIDLVDGLLGVATDLELDQGGMTTSGDLARVGAFKRRADLLQGVQLRQPVQDVVDRLVERWTARGQRLALEEDALARWLLEPGVENPIGAARLAWS